MTTQILVYNQALSLMGERRLTSTSEARDARYHLDNSYAVALSYCLEQGFWNFAMRAAQLDASVSVEPSFGYQFAFTKPTDWVRTYIISASETFDPQLLTINDEAGYWYANVDPLFIKYVSNDTSYGADLSLWPETYAHYVASRLAVMTAPAICTASETKMSELYAIEKRARVDARSKDAMNEPPQFPPRGSWSQSRGGGRSRLSGTSRGLPF